MNELPLNFQPGVTSVRSSRRVLIWGVSEAAIARAAPSTSSRPFPVRMGTMTACTGATWGGSTSPRSSPWTMISPPSIRQLTPQDVVQASFSVLSLSRNLMLKARAKFCPRLCEVPACSACPSGISASMA